MNQKRTSVYRQLMIVFAGTVLPLILLGSIVLFSSNGRLRRDALESAARATFVSAQNLDASMKNIYQANFPLLGQSNVLKLSNRIGQLSVYEKLTAVKTLREQLTGINNANAMIENIRIYFRDWGRTYNSSGYEGGSFQDVPPEEYEKLLSMARSGKICHPDGQGLSILISDALSGDSASLIEVTLSTHNMERIFQELCTLEDDYYLFSVTDSSYLLENVPEEYLEGALALLSEEDPADSTVRINGKAFYVFRGEIPSINSRFIRIVATDSLQAQLELLTLFTVAFVILVFCCCLLFFAVTRRLIHKPLSQLVAGFAEVERGNYSLRIPYNSKNDFSYLYHGFNHMTANIEKSIERDYQTKILLQRAELKQLQAQINPHFLFNSFFMLQRTIKSGMQEEAEEIAKLLGKYFQYITQNSQNLVPLCAEYEHAQIYANIQGMRFEGRIQVELAPLPASCAMVQVPKLILQPVLENAFQYGIGNKLADGILRLYFEEEEETLQIVIEDNGDTLSDEDIRTLSDHLSEAREGGTIEMTGILNICRRLALFSEGKGSLGVQRSPLGGLLVKITLQKEGSVNEKIIDC